MEIQDFILSIISGVLSGVIIDFIKEKRQEPNNKNSTMNSISTIPTDQPNQKELSFFHHALSSFVMGALIALMIIGVIITYFKDIDILFFILYPPIFSLSLLMSWFLVKNNYMDMMEYNWIWINNQLFFLYLFRPLGSVFIATFFIIIPIAPWLVTLNNIIIFNNYFLIVLFAFIIIISYIFLADILSFLTSLFSKKNYKFPSLFTLYEANLITIYIIMMIFSLLFELISYLLNLGIDIKMGNLVFFGIFIASMLITWGVRFNLYQKNNKKLSII